ncbi:hypothetical protein K492DRAFT_179286 [Lichtheimia hyalospora FSU 10163]|nr:hypothetical protein K492DRAFT_179286 [Lichtheimia hyalospora FSU 10163]
MQAIGQATNLSNWTLSLVLGAAAALKSGAREGVPGELPISDTLLGVTSHHVKNGVSGDNVFIGLDTHWARMMLKSFATRRMKFCYLLIKEDKAPKCPECPGRCPMVPDPMTDDTDGSKAKDIASAVASAQEELLKPVQLHGEIPTGIDPPQIRPNMFYSLVTDYLDYKNNRMLYKVIHRPDCIPTLTIDKRATEFLSDTLSNRLKNMSNDAAMNWCESVINDIDANEWDQRIIGRIQDLMQYPGEKQQSDVYLNEVMDRIHSRVADMLERLRLKTFTAHLDDIEEDYSIADIPTCFIVYFGIRRAIAMSERIYNENSLVFMGYNINLAHEIIRDLTEIQSQNAGGYSSRLVVESTASGRIVDRINEPNHVFQLAVFVDTALSVGILMLSHLGPVLSMYTSRRMTAPYRESCMRMGTSMRWSVLQVSLLHSGTARDDWMVCIKPTQRWRLSLFLFVGWSIFSSIGSVIAWPFLVHPSIEPIEAFGDLVAIISVVIGVPWVILATSVKLQRNNSKTNWEACRRIICDPHTVINLALVIVLIILAEMRVTIDWIYLYLLEAIYFFQWLVGEVSGKWVYQSTAWFMLGALGAFRLSNVADDN